jgi:hypothetical protein
MQEGAGAEKGSLCDYDFDRVGNFSAKVGNL